MNAAEMTAKLAELPALTGGTHDDIHEGCSVMEAAAYVAGEPWSDHPPSVCRRIGAFLRVWNDALPDAERDTLLRPLILRLPGTRATPEIDMRRAIMATDWLVREYTPAWLRQANLSAHAEALQTLPEITDPSHLRLIMPTLDDALDDAFDAVESAPAAAYAAAKGAARDAAGDEYSDAPWDAVGVAAHTAAGQVVWGADWDTVWDAAWADAWGKLWAGAWAAACAATWAAAVAGPDLASTRRDLQQSALRLVDRMINAGKQP
jgi:ElaB/YqjD/DUF883 family membrane-anchored ribosome-binding protein